MNLDMRFLAGLMFTIIGIILAAFGYSTNDNAALYARSLGINVNLWWGLVLLVFGQILFQLGRRAQLPPQNLPHPKLAPRKPRRTK
jgi:hypothetical protein